MIPISQNLSLKDEEVEFIFKRSSGPGGQNVNKVSTAVQLRFNIAQSKSLSDTVKRRLIQLAGGRINGKGFLQIDASNYRSQRKNREDAVNRLILLIRKALVRRKYRIPSKPTKGSQVRRMDSKKKKGDIKRSRNRPSIDLD